MSAATRRKPEPHDPPLGLLTGRVSATEPTPPVELRPVDEPRTGGDLATARAIVAAVPPTSPESERARLEILAFLDAHPDALHRTCLAGHLTGSALVVDSSRTRVLLMLHTKLGRWLQPGGHADGEGFLGAVALREATEETGIEGLQLLEPAVDCDVHVIPERGAEPEHLHLDVRHVVLAPPDARVVGNAESQALRWVTLDEVQALATDDSLVRLAKAGMRLVERTGAA